MTKPTVMVSGTPCGAGRNIINDPRCPNDKVSIRIFIEDYPRRFVVLKFFYRCWRCTRRYRLWMTDDSIWKRLPYLWRRRDVCTWCFRSLCPGVDMSQVRQAHDDWPMRKILSIAKDGTESLACGHTIPKVRGKRRPMSIYRKCQDCWCALDEGDDE